MQLSDFDFDLPDRLIATRPARPRRSAKLLVAQGDSITDSTVADIGAFLRPGDRLILNDTKVIPARLNGTRHRETDDPSSAGGARIEVTLLDTTPDGDWRAMVKPLKKLRDGEEIVFDAGLRATCIGRQDGQGILRFNLEGDAFDTALNEAGAMPLPPYIASRRPADAQDKEDYQTVWASRPGAVAAPTASLHFDAELLEELASSGINFTHVTLHVGAGTFLPVKVDDVTTHKMHAEWGDVSEDAAREIRETKANGGRIIPVGTTALRLIESAARAGQMTAWRGETDIFIYPGFEFQITDGLMTNFHLPKSTLMMLVAALMGHDHIRSIYDHAIAENYRFFSYGDSSLLIPS